MIDPDSEILFIFFFNFWHFKNECKSDRIVIMEC